MGIVGISHISDCNKSNNTRTIEESLGKDLWKPLFKKELPQELLETLSMEFTKKLYSKHESNCFEVHKGKEIDNETCILMTISE